MAELARIGKTDEALCEGQLDDCPHVLATSAAQRLAREQELDFPAAACRAILRAIESLPTKRLRVIGAALMTARQEFNGLNVAQRKELIYRRHGITIDDYKRGRPVALREIATFLLGQPSREDCPHPPGDVYTEVPHVGKMIPVQHSEAIEVLTSFAGDATRWAIFCGAYPTVKRLDDVEVVNGRPTHSRLRLRSVHRQMVHAVTALTISSEYCFTQRNGSRYDEVLTYLGHERTARIRSRLDTYFDAISISQRERERAFESMFEIALPLSHRRNRLLDPFAGILETDHPNAALLEGSRWAMRVILLEIDWYVPLRFPTYSLIDAAISALVDCYSAEEGDFADLAIRRSIREDVVELQTLLNRQDFSDT